MYFNQSKENTNIDDEFDKKKINIDFNFNKYKKPIIIGGIILVIVILIIIIASLSNNKTKYFIILKGTEEMSIYENDDYIEPGYTAYDNKRNNLNDQVKITGKVDSTKVGTYKITYTLNKTTKTRTVNVIAKPDTETFIHLLGDLNMRISVGETYKEPGYTAVDITDGDITKKVTVTGKVNTSKKGVYKITYSVVNSKGISTSAIRTITVE